MSLNYSRQGKHRRLRRDVIASYDYPFLLCNQTVGFYPEMGRLWISKDYPYNDEFSAYMDTKEFVRSFYMSLMTELGLNH